MRYVNAANPNPVPPYTSWDTAATNIQDATTLAGFGDTVLVTNGVYQYGGTSFDGSNRVRVAGALLKSVNGPAVTSIVGYQVPGTTNGNSAIPSAGAAPHGQIPVAGKQKGQNDVKWGFSFRYWRQIEFFGLDGKNPEWFISLLERMGTVSQNPMKRVQTDRGLQESLHYHDIKWGQTNIPIQRSDLKWLPKDILENANDYPIYQFSISKALGRIAGFWEGSLFNVTLLDPFHNLQPTKEYNYRITPTKNLIGEHEYLLAKLSLLRDSQPNCADGKCATQQALKFIDLEEQSFGIVYLDGEYFIKAKELVNQGKAKSIVNLLEFGILHSS